MEHTVTEDGFHWRYRDESSIYSPDGTGVLEDDSADGSAMQKQAEALREEHEGTDISTKLSIPWIDLTWRPGVRVSRLAGREVDFRAAGGENPGYPTVTEVLWDFAGQRTTLTLANATRPRRRGGSA
jgi:hypothetical protein